MVLLFFCLTLSIKTVLSSESIVGDRCRSTEDITDGECVLVNDCELALRAIGENLTHPYKRCGFEGILEVICCPKHSLNSVAPIDTTAKPNLLSEVKNRVPDSIIREIGDSCKPTPDTDDGECVLVTDCEVALRQISETLTHPYTRCGFKGQLEQICCPKSSPSPAYASTSRPAPTRRPSHSGTSLRPRPPVIDKEDTPPAWFTRPVADPMYSTTPVTKVPMRVADKQCEIIKKYSLPPFSTHVIGGVDASEGEFPHMVALGYKQKDLLEFKCGATLISENYVLTAAHCALNPQNLKPTVARMGVVKIGEAVFNPETDVRIDTITVHPKYDRRKQYNDIALLRLSTPVKYSHTLSPACLYTGETQPNVTFTVTGWGRTDALRQEISVVLQKANVAHASEELCKESYMAYRKLPDGIIDSQFCAGGSADSRDTCQGDSGGPLQGLTAPDGRYRIIGITSFGRGCGSLTPGVYTKVSAFLDFIESIVWPDEKAD